MSANMPEFTVNDLTGLAPRWDELIDADIVREIEKDTVPDMRLALAIKGYREMHEILTAEIKGKSGVAALRAMALTFRSYAKERPGLSAATFRTAMVESPEWMEAARALRQLFIGAFQQYGLDEVAAGHAHRILRSLVYGYVTSEMLGAFYLPADKNESFDLAFDVFLRGLPGLTPCSHEYRSRSAASA